MRNLVICTIKFGYISWMILIRVGFLVLKLFCLGGFFSDYGKKIYMVAYGLTCILFIEYVSLGFGYICDKFNGFNDFV